MKKVFILVTILLGIIIGGIFYSFSNDIEAKESEEDKEVIEDISKKEKKEDIEEVTKIKVDVKGEVANPGVYELDSTARVIDAINMAGGLSENADTDNINLSKILTDENVIIVYKLIAKAYSIETYKEKIDICKSDYNSACISQDKVISTTSTEQTTSSNTNDDSKLTSTENIININTADLNDLITLTGIGEAKAQKIIDYRNTNGNFQNIEDIKNVTGIGDSIFEKIKDRITV